MSDVIAAAAPQSYALETTTCSRCGGCGQHSFNLLHGSTCYGCSGSGKALTKAAKKVSALLQAHLDSCGLRRKVGRGYECELRNIPVGAFVLNQRTMMYSKLAKVTEDKSKPMGWQVSHVAGQEVRTITSWEMTYELEDGTVVVTSNCILRRLMTTAERQARLDIFRAHVGNGVVAS